MHSKKPWQHSNIIIAQYYHGSNEKSKKTEYTNVVEETTGRPRLQLGQIHKNASKRDAKTLPDR